MIFAPRTLYRVTAWTLWGLLSALLSVLDDRAGVALAAGPAILDRYVTSVALTNSVPVTIDLPRDFLYGGIRLRFTGTLTISAGTTNGTPVDDNPMSYLNKLIVEGTGGGQSIQLKNVKGIHAFRAEHFMTGTEGNANPVTSGAIATTNFYCEVKLWFISQHVDAIPEVKYRSVLNPREFSKLTLEIDPGTTGDFIQGGDRTVALSAQNVDIYALQAVNYQLTQPPLRFIETMLLRDSLSAIATERRLSNPLPVGRPYRYLMLRTTNETGNLRQPVDDTLGAVKLFVSQTLVFRYKAFQEYAQQARVEHGIVTATNPSGLDALGSRDNAIVGMYFFDFMKEGRMDGVLDTSRFPMRGVPLDFLHDIATASARQLDVVAGFLVPPPAVAAAPSRTVRAR